MKPRLKKTVVLVGMMGAGKTAVGTQLAKILAVPFRDSDDEIVKAANMSIPEIFARDGEAFFRQKEAQVLSRLLQGPPGVLSTGGGAYLAESNREAISTHGIAVWLRADLEVLWQRVRYKSTRPLLQTADPLGTLSALLDARTPIYSQAEIVVDSLPHLSIEAMADKVAESLAARPDVLERK